MESSPTALGKAPEQLGGIRGTALLSFSTGVDRGWRLETAKVAFFHSSLPSPRGQGLGQRRIELLDVSLDSLEKRWMDYPVR